MGSPAQALINRSTDPQSLIQEPSYTVHEQTNSSPLFDDFSDVTSLGMPAEDTSSINPVVLVRNPTPIFSQGGGFIDSLEEAVGNGLNAVGHAGSVAWQSIGDAVGEATKDVMAGTSYTYDAIKGVGNDAVGGVTKVLDVGVSRTVLLALGLGVAIYIATKTGAIKVLL